MSGQRPLLLKGAAWVSAGSAFASFLSFASLIALTRLLLPEDFGLVAIAASVAEILGVITELSLGAALIQRHTVEKVHFDTAWTMNAMRGALVAVLIAVSGPFVAYFYGDPRLGGLLQFLALATFISGLTNPKLVVFKRRLDFRQVFIMAIANKTTAFVFSIAVAVIYQSYWALVVGVVASGVVTLIVSYVLMPYRPRVTLAAWRDLLSFSVWLTVSTWVQALNWRSTSLLLGYFLPTAVLGQHRVGTKLGSATINQATAPIKSLLFPAFSRLQDDSQRLRGGYMRSQGAICLITFPIAAGVALLAQDIVLLLVGDKWLPAVPVVQMMAMLRMLQSIHNVNALAMATANTQKLFYRELWGFCVRWPIILTGMYLGRADPYSMLFGALCGQIIATAIVVVWNITLISMISSVSIRDHAAFIWRPFVSIAVMAALVLVAANIVPHMTDPLGLALRVATLAAIGAIIYFASLFAIWIVTGRAETVEKELATLLRSFVTKAIKKVRAA